MKSFIKQSKQSTQEIFPTLKTNSQSPEQKIKNYIRPTNSALSENNVKYDEESYLKYNDITSFKHKTLLEDELKTTTTTTTTTTINNSTIQIPPQGLLPPATLQPLGINVNDNENLEDDFYKNIFDNLKNKKIDENKLTNLKHFYAKVRYLNRKHSEKRKTDNKISRKLNINNRKDYDDSNLIRMNTYSDATKMQQHQQQLLNDTFNEKEKNIINQRIDEEFNEEDDEEDEDELDENENENENQIVNEDPDQYFYNILNQLPNDLDKSKLNTTLTNDNINNANNNTNSLIDVKSIRNYFNIIVNTPPTATTANTLKEPTIVLNKSKTRLNLFSQSAPNAYTNANKQENDDFSDSKYKDNFYKEFTIYKQKENSNLFKQQKEKTFLLPISSTQLYRNHLNNLIASKKKKSKYIFDHNLKLIAKSTSFTNNEKESDKNNINGNDISNEIGLSYMDGERFNESLKKKETKNLHTQSNSSLLLSNLIKLRLAQYTNNHNNKTKLNNSTNNLKQDISMDLSEFNEELLSELNLKKSQLKIQGVGNTSSNTITTNNTNNNTINKIRPNIKLPSIRSSKPLENLYLSDSFGSSLIITKSIENSYKNQLPIKQTKRENNQSPLTNVTMLTSSTTATTAVVSKPKIPPTKVVEDVKEKKKVNNNNNNNNNATAGATNKINKIESDSAIKKDKDINSNNKEEKNINYDNKKENHKIKNDENNLIKFELESDNLEETNNSQFYNDEKELLNKSNGNYKYIASSTSKISNNNNSYELTLPEIREPKQRVLTTNNNNNNNNNNNSSSYRASAISPLKFNTNGLGALPPIKLNLHVNNEHNYKNFERGSKYL